MQANNVAIWDISLSVDPFAGSDGEKISTNFHTRATEAQVIEYLNNEFQGLTARYNQIGECRSINTMKDDNLVMRGITLLAEPEWNESTSDFTPEVTCWARPVPELDLPVQTEVETITLREAFELIAAQADAMRTQDRCLLKYIDIKEVAIDLQSGLLPLGEIHDRLIDCAEFRLRSMELGEVLDDYLDPAPHSRTALLDTLTALAPAVQWKLDTYPDIDWGEDIPSLVDQATEQVIASGEDPNPAYLKRERIRICDELAKELGNDDVTPAPLQGAAQ